MLHVDRICNKEIIKLYHEANPNIESWKQVEKMKTKEDIASGIGNIFPPQP